MPASPRSTLLLLVAAAVPAVAAFRATAVPPSPDPALAASTPSAWRPAALTGAAGWGMGGRLQDVVFDGRGVGLAVGPEKRLWRSDDAGRSWRRAESPVPVGIGLALRGDGTGLMVGLGGRAARTEDGGASWKPVKTGVEGPLGSVAFVGERGAVAVGRAVVRSTDDGRSWSRVDAPEVLLYSVAFSPAGVGLIVGAAGVVLRSTDQGATWRRVPVETRAMLRDVAVLDERQAVAVGSGGTILRTGNGGRTWTRVRSGTDQHLRDVAFTDGRNGVVVGFSGTVLRTADGGRSWRSEPSGTAAHLFSVATTPDAVVAAGWGTTLLRAPMTPSGEAKP